MGPEEYSLSRLIGFLQMMETKFSGLRRRRAIRQFHHVLMQHLELTGACQPPKDMGVLFHQTHLLFQGCGRVSLSFLDGMHRAFTCQLAMRGLKPDQQSPYVYSVTPTYIIPPRLIAYLSANLVIPRAIRYPGGDTAVSIDVNRCMRLSSHLQETATGGKGRSIPDS